MLDLKLGQRVFWYSAEEARTTCRITVSIRSGPVVSFDDTNAVVQEYRMFGSDLVTVHLWKLQRTQGQAETDARERLRREDFRTEFGPPGKPIPPAEHRC